MAVNQWIGNYYVGSDGLWIPDNSISLEEQNALNKALDYLKILAFSRSGLIEQLQYEGFSLKPRRMLLITAVLIGTNKQPKKLKAI